MIGVSSLFRMGPLNHILVSANRMTYSGLLDNLRIEAGHVGKMNLEFGKFGLCATATGYRTDFPTSSGGLRWEGNLRLSSNHGASDSHSHVYVMKPQ